MIVQVEQVSLTYQSREGEVEALRDLTFSVAEGEFVSLVGPSGCGKSTLLSLIAGLEHPTTGRVLLEGEEVTGPSEKIGFMAQRDQLFEWRTILGNCMLGPEIRGDTSVGRREGVAALLARYGLGEFLHSTPSQLSGGMRQRAALIRTMALSPRILLLDESFSALDYQTRLSVSADILGIIKKEGITALLVTHDISEAISLSDRVLVLSKRPATIRADHQMEPLLGLGPEQRREHPAFQQLFHQIWKELDIHV